MRISRYYSWNAPNVATSSKKFKYWSSLPFSSFFSFETFTTVGAGLTFSSYSGRRLFARASAPGRVFATLGFATARRWWSLRRVWWLALETSFLQPLARPGRRSVVAVDCCREHYSSSVSAAGVGRCWRHAWVGGKEGVVEISTPCATAPSFPACCRTLAVC